MRRTRFYDVSTGLIEMLEPRRLLTTGTGIAAVGQETRVNSFTPGNQDSPAVAMDSLGNYVVVWSSGGQDGNGFGVFARRYNAAGIATGNEFQVNTYTTSDQTLPSVAMDAAGAFVVAWMSQGEDGSGKGIYAQRYNAAGVAQGVEFRVNTFTTSDQTLPEVAMDAVGDFAITWQSTNQDGSGYGIYARRYNAAGAGQGAEFKVNTDTTGPQALPSIAMDAAGAFVVTWRSFQDGGAYGVYAQRYTAAGAVQGSEFQVNTYTTGDQKNSRVAMDAAGDFVITYESQGQDNSGYGIFARRYNSGGTPQGLEFQVNTFTTGSQFVPNIAMDPAGDFAVTWTSGGQDGNADGTFGQRFSSLAVAQGAEFPINTYTTSDQALPRVTMDNAGDFVVAWESNKQDGSGYGIYSQRYVRTVGPIVTAVREGTGESFLQQGDRLTSNIGDFLVDFSDSLNTIANDSHDVTLRSNWQLMRYGVDISNQISYINFFNDPSKNFYQATVIFSQYLTDGVYQLVARQTIQDVTGRAFDGEADGITGGDFHFNFEIANTLPEGAENRVNTHTLGNQTAPSVAMDAAGSSVAVWASDSQDGSGLGIYAQRYNASGIAVGGEFQVNSYTTNSQTAPSVAIDATGNFVVTWESNQQDGSGYGIYARRFNAAGVAVSGEFQVNTDTTGSQVLPAVAMDATGDFTIAWGSFGADGNDYGIEAQQYNAAGAALGVEFPVNTSTTGAQNNPAIAMNATGDFVVSWSSYGQDGSASGIFAQRYSILGTAQGSEFQVNTYTTGNQQTSRVAMDLAGDFVIVWKSAGEDLSGYGIFAQLYDSAGFTQGIEFQVNTFTTNTQNAPTVAMDAAGDFVVAWTSNGQDGSSYGIFARQYSLVGTPQSLDFGINTFTTNFQAAPAVAMDAEGDFVAAWQSFNQDGSGYGIYSQRYQTDTSPWLSQIETTPLNAAGPLITPVTSTLQALDFDSSMLTGATIEITNNYHSDQDQLKFNNTATISGSWNAGTGVLTLTGTDTVANYQAALRSITYHNTMASPNTAVVRTLEFQVTDGLLTSNFISRDLNVFATSAPAVISGVSGTGTYDENAPAIALAGNLLITDPNVVHLTSATVSFTNWQAEDRVNFNNIFALQHTFTQNLATHTASLVITGTDTVFDYQVLLRSVVYWDVSDNPNLTIRVASFKVSDGLSSSNAVTRNIKVLAANDAPVLSAIESDPLAYKANDPAFPPLAISSTLLIGDADSSNLTKAVVQISAGYQNDAGGHDVLSFTSQFGISGSFNVATGTLTLTGTSSGGNYRTAIRSVKFSSSGSAVSTANRTLTITATDDFFPTPATSIAITRDVTVSTTNIPPSVYGIAPTSLAYVRGTAAMAVAPGLSIADPDSINLTAATIKVSSNYQNGQDVLAFTAGFGVTGTFVAATGTLSLTGTTSLANYQTLLRSVTYKTNTAAASTLSRTINFTVSDGLASGNTASRNVTLT